MIRKALLTTFAAMMMMALSSVAHADTITVVGNANGALATANVNCSFNAQTNTFTFTITNTSPFDARITAVGFDILPGNVNGFSAANVGAFTFSDANLGNVAQFNSADLDFGFLTGSNFNGGSPNDGLDFGQSLTFTVSGAAFSGLTEEAICNAIFVRFQRVGANGQGSDVGTANTPTPEPLTMMLFGTGLAGVAARARRQRQRGKV